MSERESISVRPGKKVYLENGFQIFSRKQKKKETRKQPSTTARHEAKHAGVAEVRSPGSVEMASIVPGPGYLGITKMSRMDIVAAAAPHAEGMSGTGWDVQIIKRMGGDVHAASAAARSIMQGIAEEVDEIAYALEEKKSLSGSEIRDVMQNTDDRQEIIIFITSPTGEEQTITQEATQPQIALTSTIFRNPQEKL